MTKLSKVLLVVALTAVTGGILIDHHGVYANPSLAAVLPLGAIAIGMFLIVFMMENEMAKYDEEQTAKTQLARGNAPAPESICLKQRQIEPIRVHIPAMPPKLNNILVPIDFSNASKKALQYAIHFARELNAQIILLHVFPPQRSAGTEYDDEATHRLKSWAEEFVPGEIKTQIQTRRGSEAIEIINAARNSTAGLMIISTHGLTGRAHALAGSLAENLVQLAPCPVLVVRENECDFIETNADDASATTRLPHFAATAI